jgi:hypothetical protein
LIEITFQNKRRILMNKYRTKLLIAMQLCAVVLLTSFTAASASAETSATAPAKETVTLQSGVDDVTPPQVPDNIKVTEDGVIPFLVGHADGTQNYVCKPSGAGFAYALFTPEATLFNGHDKQLITHYFSPNPQEANTDPRVDGNLMIRATWQHLDTSTIWAGVHKNGAAIVDPDSVAWLLLDVVGNLDRWSHSVAVLVRPAGEHHWRKSTEDGLFLVSRRRQGGVRALQGRLLLLEKGRPVDHWPSFLAGS